jgi:H+-transporting ATPase
LAFTNVSEVNDAPSLKKADTGIAVEGASDAARSAADIVFLAPGLGAIIDALKTSRQIFHRMYAYVVYRIALSIHLEIFLGLWIAILNESLNIELVVFIAIFADVATLAIAYDNAPFSKTPVKWNLPKLWGMSILLGVVLAVGTWICLTTMIAQGENGGIVQNFGRRDPVLFLEISLTENWLIFITRANGPFWSSLPSWQLAGAILVVDILATFFTLFGWFVGGQTSIVAVVRVWVFSFGVFCIMGGLYYLLQDNAGFDNLMHGKSPKKNQKQRSLEDFGKNPFTCFLWECPWLIYSNSCFAPTCIHSAREDCLNTSAKQLLLYLHMLVDHACVCAVLRIELQSCN